MIPCKEGGTAHDQTGSPPFCGAAARCAGSVRRGGGYGKGAVRTARVAERRHRAVLCRPAGRAGHRCDSAPRLGGGQTPAAAARSPKPRWIGWRLRRSRSWCRGISALPSRPPNCRPPTRLPCRAGCLRWCLVWLRGRTAHGWDAAADIMTAFWHTIPGKSCCFAPPRWFCRHFRRNAGTYRFYPKRS